MTNAVLSIGCRIYIPSNITLQVSDIVNDLKRTKANIFCTLPVCKL